MTRQMLDPANDLAAVHEATARLLDAVEAMDPATVGEPSLLTGWSRGHVLTHISRNADSLVNLFTWARTGEEIPQYPSAEARDKDIEDGAGRPLHEHVADLRESAERMRLAAEAVPPQGWATQLTMRSGIVVPAAEIPWRRLVEVELHHVDLGTDYTTDRLPDDFVTRVLGFVLDGLHAHEGIAAVRLRDADSGEAWEIGAAEEFEATVTGTQHALLGWVTGRSGGEGLDVRPQGPLPTLPPLG